LTEFSGAGSSGPFGYDPNLSVGPQIDRQASDKQPKPDKYRPVHSAPLGSLFLIDVLFLAEATDRAVKADANIERHRPVSRPSPADAYTLDESRSRRRIPRNV
jgi:hypothetical protein